MISWTILEDRSGLRPLLGIRRLPQRLYLLRQANDPKERSNVCVQRSQSRPCRCEQFKRPATIAGLVGLC